MERNKKARRFLWVTYKQVEATFNWKYPHTGKSVFEEPLEEEREDKTYIQSGRCMKR